MYHQHEETLIYFIPVVTHQLDNQKYIYLYLISPVVFTGLSANFTWSEQNWVLIESNNRATAIKSSDNHALEGNITNKCCAEGVDNK